MSLRNRLLLALGAAALVALLGADIATYSSLRSFLYDRVDQSLSDAFFAVDRAIDRPGGRATVSPGTYVEIRDQEGNLVGEPVPGRMRNGDTVAPRLPAVLAPAPQGPDSRGARYFTVPSVDGRREVRVRTGEIRGGGQLVVGVPLDDLTATLHRLFLIELAVTLGALAVALAAGWYLIRLGLRPLAAVEETAAAIADGQLDRRVPGDDAPTEVGRLSRALNVMLGRIEDAFSARDATEAQLRRFVADASHELRTPIAAVAAYAELFERGADRTRPDDLARVMTGIRHETGRMGELVEDLLLLARLDEGRPLSREPVELVALAAEAVGAATAVGPSWPVRLKADQPVEVSGDAARLRQVLDNLLANVRRHTPAGTSAEVHVSSAAGWAVVAVADRGPGLAEEHGPRVFERFYRTESSRSRETGGAGLGLSIVAAIVAAHGGRVAATPTPGGGATFTVRLPVSGPPPLVGEVDGGDDVADTQPDE